MRRILPTFALLILTACSTVGGGRWSYGELQAACLRDGGARWLGAPPASLEGLLVVGSVRDPALTGGSLLPENPDGYSGAEGDWMTRTGLTTVFLYLKPNVDADERLEWITGPFKGEPAGVYQFDLLPASNPRCRPVLERYERYRQGEFARGALQSAYPDLETCRAYSYQGPLDLTAYPFIYVNWWDSSLKGSGATRRVHEIRRGSGETAGRAVFYGSSYELKLAPGCFFKTSTFHGWFPDSPIDPQR